MDSTECKLYILMNSNQSRDEIVNRGRVIIQSVNSRLNNELANIYALNLIQRLLSHPDINGCERDSLFSKLDILYNHYPINVSLIWDEFYPIKNNAKISRIQFLEWRVTTSKRLQELQLVESIETQLEYTREKELERQRFDEIHREYRRNIFNARRRSHRDLGRDQRYFINQYNNSENVMIADIQNPYYIIVRELLKINLNDSRDFDIDVILSKLNLTTFQTLKFYKYINYKHFDIKIGDLIINVWKFISLSDNFENAQISLSNVISENCEDCCITGMATKIINSIQGYFNSDEYPQLIFQLNTDDEIFVTLYNLINKELSDKNLDPLYDFKQSQILANTVLNENIANEYVKYPCINSTQLDMKRNILAKYNFSLE